MGVLKRIKELKREISYVKQQQASNDLFLYCSTLYPFDEEIEDEEEKSKKLESRLHYLENALMSEEFELNCIKGSMIMVMGLAIFVICKYYLFI